MRHLTPIILLIIGLASCDCVQEATGLVIDSQTMEPIDSASLGKYEKEDSINSYSRRTYSDNTGKFEYHGLSGGFRKCPDLTLYFNKKGYKTTKITFKSFSKNNNVLLDKIHVKRDSSKRISKVNFDRLIDTCILLLQTKQLQEISDEQHIQIMMCLNTIFMRDFEGGHYKQLESVANEKDYTKEITKVYNEWIPNRGMGFYFPKLKMELYGTPSLFSIYNVIN